MNRHLSPNINKQPWSLALSAGLIHHCLILMKHIFTLCPLRNYEISCHLSMQLELGLYKQTVKPGDGFGEADGGRGAGGKRVSAVCLFVQPVCCSALCSLWETSHCLTAIYTRLVKRLLMKYAKVDADFGWTGMADTQMWLFSLPRNSVSLTTDFLKIFYWEKNNNPQFKMQQRLLKLEVFHLYFFLGVEALAWLAGRSVPPVSLCRAD